MTQHVSGHKEILRDEKGQQTEVFIYRDIILPGSFPDWFDPVQKLKSIKDFPFRQGDVLQCAFPKSGLNQF
jgi:hypothetical protein